VHVKRNAEARAGDVLVLGKPLGVGVLSAALKKEKLSLAGYRQLIDNTTRLNTPGIALATMPGVHALTDVTGFGLAGHALELARGAKLTAIIDWPRVPLLEGVARDGGGRLRDRRLGAQLGRAMAKRSSLRTACPPPRRRC
jgi:selenide,water dikinase